jgi:adenylate cyclase class 2
MQTEIEAKFLHVNHAELREKLKALGAICEQPLRQMRRKNYDHPDGRLGTEFHGWVRLRDEGDKITLSYKQLNDRTLHGTKEVSLTVNSYDATDSFLQAIGLAPNSFQETKRESWRIGDVQIELDEWPWIDPFIEIEGPSEAAVHETAETLGLVWDDAVYGSVEIAYQAAYDVTEDEIDSWQEITFTPVPSWLEAKRRKVAA